MALPALLAPILGPLLTNGLNLVANAVMAKGKDYVEKKLGVELKPDMSPEEIAKLKIAEMEHEEELIKLKLESDKLGLTELDMRIKDNESARSRETSISTSSTAPLLNKIITPVLAIIVLSLTFWLFASVIFDSEAVDASRKDILIYVLGVLSTICSQIVSYYFGSSQGSKEKSEHIKGLFK